MSLVYVYLLEFLIVTYVLHFSAVEARSTRLSESPETDLASRFAFHLEALIGLLHHSLRCHGEVDRLWKIRGFISEPEHLLYPV